MRSDKLLIGFFLLALLVPNSTYAGKNQVKAPVWDKLTPAWDAVSERLIAFAGEKKQKLLADLAFAVAAAEQCDGLNLDKDKFKSAFDSLNDAGLKSLSPADKAEYGPKLMNYFGIYVGLITAEALLEPNLLCTYAINQQLIGKGQYWIDAGEDKSK